MRIHLAYNASAGAQDHRGEELIQNIERAGHRVELHSPKEEIPGLNPPDLLVVAGGDGTVGKVVRRLCRRAFAGNIPIAIIPLGVANNVARSLGVARMPAAFIQAGNGGAHRRGEDPPADRRGTLSVAAASWNGYKKHFIESVGCGLLSELLRVGDREKPARAFADKQAELRYWIARLETLARTFDAFPCRVSIDGHDRSGNYLMVEVMNIPRIGPGLALAPALDPGRDNLGVVFVPEDGRERLGGYLSKVKQGAKPGFPFPVVAGRRIQFQCDRAAIHVDDKSLDAGRTKASCVIEAGACRVPVLF